MTGAALELIKPAPGLVLGADEHQWNQMIREARVLASTALVPRAMQGKPEVVLAAMCVCEAYGADRRLAINQVHYMNNELVPSAQLRIGIAVTRGYEISWSEKVGGHLSSTRATIAIRKPGRRWETFTFTHDDAVRAGKFDEWVELWPQGGKKQTWIVRRDGQPYRHETDTPQWVHDAVAAGALKRYDGWWNYEEDMLASAVARKAIRRYVPDALLGIDSLAVSPTGDIETGEIFDDEDDAMFAPVPPGASSTLGPESTPPAPGPASAPTIEGAVASTPPGRVAASRAPAGPEPPGPASALERQLLHRLIDGLSDGQRADLRARVKAYGMAPLDSDRFTVEDGGALMVLLAAVEGKAEAVAKGSAAVEEVGGAGESTGEPAPTYAPDEEPFDA